MSDVELIEPIEIELDKKRLLKITMRGMMVAERKLRELRGDQNLSLWTLPLAELARGDVFSIDTSMALLWAGLVHEDKALTFDQVLDIVTDPKDVLLKVCEAFRRFYKLNENDDAQVAEEVDDEKKNLPLNGLNSGHSPESNSD